MNLMCLNCRGCGRPEAVRELRNLVELSGPKVLFLSETKMCANKAETELRRRLGFANGFGLIVGDSVEGWQCCGQMMLWWI
jgi:hypothetical protein